jgi:RNA-directed DNA polymerase
MTPSGQCLFAPLDHLLSESGYQMVRYADDFVILCRTQEEAESALAVVRTWVEANGLTLYPQKTQFVHSDKKSFAFLGYSFRKQLRFPREKSHRKILDRIRELTPRKSGRSLEAILQDLNRTFQGWFHYFRHCTWNIFRVYDERIRARLRRILLKRQRRNPKRLPANRRWPNDFFTKEGLFSLNAAHIRFVQS